MPEPAMKKLIANLTEYVKSYMVPQNNQPQINVAQLVGMQGGGDLPQEENFDIDARTTPAP
jgi:hypothetical protein